MNPLIRFFRYDNTVPLVAIGLVLFAGGAFAASPEARDAVLRAEEMIVSIDNSYIVDLDLDSYTPKIQIVDVKEDDDNYYVSYTFTTIDLANNQWQEVPKDKMLTVAKNALGGKDLGLYVTRELSEVIALETTRLKETQAIERNLGISQAVVATTYSGLIGKFLDSKEEILPGYTPVIAEQEPGQTAAGGQSSGSSSSVIADPNSGDTIAPVITILGNNPAKIKLKATYSDLGALVTDNVNKNIGYSVALNGTTVRSVSIDTTVVGEHTVTYTAKDQVGNTTTATRRVIVYDPTVQSEEEINALIPSHVEEIPAPDSESSQTDNTTSTTEAAPQAPVTEETPPAQEETEADQNTPGESATTTPAATEPDGFGTASSTPLIEPAAETSAEEGTTTPPADTTSPEEENSTALPPSDTATSTATSATSTSASSQQ